MGTRDRGTLLSYRGVNSLLHDIAARAGIRKRVHPHLFRHSRATKLANYLTEAQMKQYFGWVQNSDMASVYVHLSGRDVDKALLALNGIAVNDKEEQEKFRAKTCPRCKLKNSPDSKFCNACGLALDLETAIKLDQARAKLDRLFDKLTEDPQKLDKLLNLIETA